MFGFDNLYQFTIFLNVKYNVDIQVDDIFVPAPINLGNPMIYVIKPDKRETMLSFYKSVMREIKLKEIGI